MPKSEKKKPIEQYDHKGKERLNNPPVGLVTPETDRETGKRTYAYDFHLDPQLVWAGKAEHTSFEVPTISLHVHERIEPRTIIEAVRKRNGSGAQQASFFHMLEENPPLREAIDFYKHPHHWSNRLIAGDSLLVINSLLEKEGMAGKVQMVYIDPPYGIKYGSNFQPFVNKRDVKDGKDEDLTAEPEMIKAFRDTWELGIHSYLTYLRDRLLLARELLTESGSVFVQISDENVHHVREIMDEVFGRRNFQRIITIQKRSPQPDKFLSGVADYLLWFSKDRERSKYNELYWFSENEYGDGFVTSDLTSSHEYHRTPFEFEGQTFTPGNRYWSTSIEGLQNLAKAGRLIVSGSTLRYKRFKSDWPYQLIGNIWDDVVFAPFMEDKLYAVQTSVKAIQRCLLMTTDPGDLVFDPTCVREGTRVLTRGVAPCDPPRTGDEGKAFQPVKLLDEPNDSPQAGDGETGQTRPPVHGEEILSPRSRGDYKGAFLPIETLKPGDMAIGHDGQPHRILRIIRKPYRGPMVGIRHRLSPQTLWLTADHPVLCKPRPRTLGGHRDWSAIPVEHRERVRELRRDASPPERKLWSALHNRQLGVKFRRQHPIGPYIADFYSRDCHTVVEVDGSTHFEPDQIAYDADRDSYMRSMGLDVLRFTTPEIESNLGGVCLAIENHIRTRLKSTEGAEWLQAGALEPGDTVFYGPDLRSAELESVERAYTQEDVYDLEIEECHSFITEVCAVHNCGSGTTAYVAEQWGRRWITCDTSRVALTLAKQRVMTAVYDYYELAHPQEGVGSGFKYKTVPHITLKSIANNEPPAQETLYDQPLKDGSKARVSGPFTVEAVPSPVVKPLESPAPLEESQADASIVRTGETLRQAEWRDELLKTGIRGKKGQYIVFSRVEALPGTRWLHAEAETKEANPQRAAISFGPEHAPLEQRQVALAIEEAQLLVPKPKIVIFAAFQFDPEAAKDIDETDWPGVVLLKAKMSDDLLTEDLKKKRASNDSFWLIGQPDVALEKIVEGKDKGKYRVEVLGFDYYNIKTGAVESGGTGNIAMWLMDTDYDGRSLLPRQVFFPMASEKEGWARLARNLKAEIDEGLIEAYRGTVSLPFEPGENRRIAVKIIDDRGIESLKIVEVG